MKHADEAVAEGRDQLLGVIATSWLVRSIGSVAHSFADVGYQEGAEPVLDMYPPDDTGRIYEPRVHFTKAAADSLLPASSAPTQWYQQGELYVRRIAPGQPSEALLQELRENPGLMTDFSQILTLYPYLRSWHP